MRRTIRSDRLPHELFSLTNSRRRQVRLSFSAVDEAAIRLGVERLARFVRTHLPVGGDTHD